MASSYEDRILRVLQHIHDNPAGDLSLDALADVAAMSRFHWHRVFRAMTGETCAQAVRRLRLHRAATWLVLGDNPVSRIAADVGYPNQKSFARAFSDAYGSSPAAFRRAGRLTPQNPTFRTGDTLMHPVVIRTDPDRRMIGLAHKGAYSEIGKSFDAFSAMCTGRNLWSRTGPMMAIYHDNPENVPEDELRSFAGAQFNGKDTPDGMVSIDIPGGRFAVMTYKGPYSGIGNATNSLYGDWLPSSGEEPADRPCLEIYRNDPTTTAPADLVTEICLPLK